MEPDAFFKLIGDQTRLRCLALLACHGELCVCELVEAIDVAQPKISRHLGLLRDHGVVDARRHGQWIFYRLSKNLPPWSLDVLRAAVQAAKDLKPYNVDAARFRPLALSSIRAA